MRTIQRNIVSGLIISKDHKLLLGLKKPTEHSSYPGYWHFPGGGVEENETQLEALKRELLEEINLDISSYHPVLIDNLGTGTSQRTLETGEVVICNMQFSCYRIDIDASSLSIAASASEELSKLEWAPLENLSNYRMPPPSFELLKRKNLTA